MTPAWIQTSYQESFNFLQARKKRQAAQLVLLSNLRRGEQNIASSLMLTLFDRVMSGVYDDKIQVKFLPSQGLTQEQINDYNLLAQSDYQEMGKAKLDYDWCWDTLFFGRGYVETIRFDKKKKILQPHVINPLTFGYDPYTENPQDWRYYWKWLTKSKNELKKLKAAGLLKVDRIEEIPSGVDPYLWDYKVKRDQAREGIAPPMQPAAVDIFQILEFYGYDDEGNKTVYWTDKNFTKILYEKKLDLQDGEELIMPSGETIELGSQWPIVVKEAFRVPHSSIPISVADLLEDKHRAKSVLLNLAYIAAKDQANPLYGYNPDKVRDISQFFSRQIDQHIPMDDETAAWPLNKASTMSPELMQFINMLTQEANEPIGTGQTLEPQKNAASQTATKTAIDQQLSDLAQSLQSKVMQFGESEFWSQWFHRYARHANDLKEKTANIIGVKGVDSHIIDLTKFNAKFPPGVMVYSAKEAEYKDLVKRRDYMQMLPTLATTMDAEGLRNFYKHVYWPLFLQDPSLIDIMFPKTLDEIQAEAENEQIQKGSMPEVKETDEHTTHIYTHMMVMPKSWELWFHIDWHQKLLAEQKQQAPQTSSSKEGEQSKVSESISFKDLPPEGQKQMAAQAGIQIEAAQPAVLQGESGATDVAAKPKSNMQMKTTSPMAAASSLKSAIKPQTVIK